MSTFMSESPSPKYLTNVASLVKFSIAWPERLEFVS